MIETWILDLVERRRMIRSLVAGAYFGIYIVEVELAIHAELTKEKMRELLTFHCFLEVD